MLIYKYAIYTKCQKDKYMTLNKWVWVPAECSNYSSFNPSANAQSLRGELSISLCVSNSYNKLG